VGNDLAVLVTYAAMLVDGNQLDKLISIGGQSPVPTIVGRLDNQGVSEGNTSMTRDDAFFGDDHSFDETLF